ncbi:MAG: M3 family oligoendopeptidase [Deltaproteobacteria bacterium]|nr:M3 family oligoendopeptidase [Deltaproteobacteria bacterium]
MNWDLASYFREFNGEEMQAFKAALQSDIQSILRRAASLPDVADECEDGWEEVVLQAEEIQKRLSHISSYIGCLASADSRNEDYRKEEAWLARLRAEFSKVRIEWLRAIKRASDELFSSFAGREAFRGAEHYLRRLREESRRTMTAEKEGLAADLGVDGLHAWGRLYDTLSGKLDFDMRYPDGRRERLPMSQRRSLMERPDRRVRQAAFQGGNAAWERVEDTAAGALNAISGTRLSLNRHRGIEDFLEVALFQSAISQKTLNAMFEALYAELELPRRILRLKAKTMGVRAVAWYDLGAPLELAGQEAISWEEAKTLVQDSFFRAYPGLGAFFGTVVDKQWVDWELRPGKRPGGFCAGSLLTNEQRIFMTFNEAMGDVLTLAHEAGHAFHSHLMRDLRPYARMYPMTLAETASTFGEMLLVRSLVQDPSVSDAQKAFLLDIETGHSAVYLLDIPVRFEFEKALYEERSRGEVSVSRLKSLMIETQRRVFGDVLEEGGEDPYFWASKLHFYITGVSFYNFPYTFGFLLSRGLFAMFQKEGTDFLARYESFLRLTGSDTAENVARRSIGRDLESPGFWAEAIRSLEEPLGQLETLLPRVLPSTVKAG